MRNANYNLSNLFVTITLRLIPILYKMTKPPIFNKGLEVAGDPVLLTLFSLPTTYRLYLSGNLLTTIDWDTLPHFHYLIALGLYSNQVNCIASFFKLIICFYLCD